MTKIGLPSNGDSVSEHFGHAPEFTIIEVDEENNILDKEILTSPGHRPGFIPRFLSEQGVEVVMACSMGKRAQDIFAAQNIEVITGVSGQVAERVKEYLKGELKVDPVNCSEHHHHDHHHNHNHNHNHNHQHHKH